MKGYMMKDKITFYYILHCAFFPLLHTSSRASHPRNFFHFFLIFVCFFYLASTELEHWTNSIWTVHELLLTLFKSNLSMNMFMNLFQFNLFKFYFKFRPEIWTCSWMLKKNKETETEIWTCSWTVHEHVNNVFCSTWQVEVWGRWLGKRYDTIDNYMLIDQNRFLSCQSQWILEAVFTMILVAYFFFTLIVMPLMSYQRNRINLDFFAQLV
jgi:hypothetical protein